MKGSNVEERGWERERRKEVETGRQCQDIASHFRVRILKDIFIYVYVCLSTYLSYEISYTWRPEESIRSLRTGDISKGEILTWVMGTECGFSWKLSRALSHLSHNSSLQRNFLIAASLLFQDEYYH